MLNSVRIRLTLWYIAVMTGVLIALALATYVILKKNAIRRTDAAAVEQADSFMKTVDAEVHDAAGSETLREGLNAAISEHRFRDTLFFVLDQSGNLLASSSDFSDRVRSALLEINEERQTLRTVHLGKRSYRCYVRPFSVERKDCTLFVLQSLHPQEEFLETVTGTFAVIIPLAVLLAGVGGYFMARRSLSPVTAMGLQAGQISADNLHARLPVQNPRDELGQLALTFNHLLDRLDLAFEQQRRFVADASHELRTPVAILCGESDVTLSQASRSLEEYRESLTILHGEALRLKHIVEDLFTLARADAGQHPLVLSDFYLDELVGESVRNMRTLASAKQIALHCEAHKEMPIRADEPLLRRMFMNLLDNAIKYTVGGGEVYVICDEADSSYRVVVRDSGEGIPSELQPRVFERFFRADKVRSRSENGGGAGLGLSISLWIAQAHGGRLELTDSGPSGTTFTVLLRQKPA
jgi:heavy metal sensor kinase